VNRRDTVGARPTLPPSLPAGASLAGGVVVASRGVGDEYLVRTSGGATVLVVLGDGAAVQHEADLLDRVGGDGAFPRVVDTGVDDAHGSYLMLAPPGDARPLAEVRPGLAGALAIVGAMLDAGRTVERMGFAWEPQRDDVHVRADGSLRVSRARVPRRLAPGERLDARAVVEAIGPTFVPVPAVEGPPSALRLLLPHVAASGERGTTIEDVRAQLVDIERDLVPPADGGAPVAGVCDQGLRRARNEDALAFAHGVTHGEPWRVLVVCDGVSSSSHAERASAAAAGAAHDTLVRLAREGSAAGDRGSAAVGAAIRAAHSAVCGLPLDAADGVAPGTTIVAALVCGRRLTVGWVGDSRAYWVEDDGSVRLTTDHSWVSEAVARGEATIDEAMQSPLAHALTRCLGRLDSADADDASGAERSAASDVAFDVRARDLTGRGWVVLCTDGFWNYFSAPDDVAELVGGAGAGASPARIARRLVAHALARGGQDNATVVVYEHRG